MDEREQSSLGRLPDGGQDPDPTWAEYVAWMDQEIENALDLTTRLPATLAAMAAGLIDEDRAAYIACYTRSLNPADAARADEILAAAAPDLRADQRTSGARLNSGRTLTSKPFKRG
jgi:hypothetical protein